MEGPDPTWPGQATLGLGLYSKDKGKPLRVAICVDTLDTVWKMDWGGEPPIDAGFHQEAVALNQKELAQGEQWQWQSQIESCLVHSFSAAVLNEIYILLMYDSP